jgi:hypothetical protein
VIRSAIRVVPVHRRVFLGRIATYVMLALLIGSCQTAYYVAAEKVGYAKRDILTTRVKSARDSQENAKEQITDALTEFGKVVNYEGGDLETQYNKLAGELSESEHAATAVHEHIENVEDVADALFKEWDNELDQYSSADLRARSAQELRQTRSRYEEMIGAMHRAEDKIEPVLVPLRDQVLFLKHNLNARAVAGLKGQVASVDKQVAQLVEELNKSIAEADRFIAELERTGG